MQDTINHWRTSYKWRDEEAKLNELPQFQTSIDIDGFGPLSIHFVHSKSSNSNAIPLLFLHGWPGSFVEVSKILPKLNGAGFDIVAPSLPGYGFSSYPDQAGFKHEQHAQTFHKLMQKLGYDKYVVQGGDWGSFIVRTMAILYPDNIQAMHINMLFMEKPDFEKEPVYTESEKRFLDRRHSFWEEESAYSALQATKPRTLGFGLHDSPVAMLAWMADKLFMWADKYPWTTTELITWTLLHYFPGPTTSLEMYHENPASANLKTGIVAREFIRVPSGLSAFPNELSIVPRSWAEKKMNIVFWQEHDTGGHFAAYEKPSELADDLTRFFKSVWK
ncbi:MAG: hypothetical protein Q9219_005378 [cf. Caloplaca sp. 3 TL-2023]